MQPPRPRRLRALAALPAPEEPGHRRHSLGPRVGVDVDLLISSTATDQRFGQDDNAAGADGCMFTSKQGDRKYVTGFSTSFISDESTRLKRAGRFYQ
jgi:hypothetical protein